MVVEQKKTKKKQVIEWIITIVVVVLLSFLVRQYVVQSVKVLGASMEPTYHHGDKLIVEKVSYYFVEPKKGEVVIVDTGEEKIIKRIVATGGDTIEIKEGFLYLNGMKMNEKYIKERMWSDYPEHTIPKGYIFVMGDNRNKSSDSRSVHYGAFQQKEIIAKVVAEFPDFMP